MSAVKVNVTNTKISTIAKYWCLNMYIDWDRIDVKIGPFTETQANKLMGKWLGYSMKCESFNDHKNRRRKSSESSLTCPLKRFHTPQFQDVSLDHQGKGLTDYIFFERDLQKELLPSQTSSGRIKIFNILWKSSVSCLAKMALVVLLANLDLSTRY